MVSPPNEAQTNKRRRTKAQHDEDLESLVDEYGTTPSTRTTVPTSTRKPNKAVIPPSLPMPAIMGELSPSPPISPSPAPTMRTRSSTSKVNRMLDSHRLAPLPPPPHH